MPQKSSHDKARMDLKSPEMSRIVLGETQRADQVQGSSLDIGSRLQRMTSVSADLYQISTMQVSSGKDWRCLGIDFFFWVEKVNQGARGALQDDPQQSMGLIHIDVCISILGS